MTQTPCPTKITTFFQTLQQTPGLDTRDNRGKKHGIALVLTGVVLALCCGRDGNLSTLHRHIVSKFKLLCKQTQQDAVKPISRAQLPLLLAKVNGILFTKLLFDWFELELDADLKRWFALDGKDLRGSIQAGHRRGEACVSALAHESQEVVQQAYYNGVKESEKPTVRQLLNDTGLYSQKLTLDALHFNPLTVNAINGAGGVYVMGLKSNQAQLYRYCLCQALIHQAAYERTDVAQRAHGRIEQRSYRCFTLAGSVLAPRWKDAGLKTLIIVKRSRQNLDGSLLSEEVSYFLSNGLPTTQAEADELFDAIRRHWRIEVMHYVRDVTLGEDAFRSGIQAVNRLMSSLRTLTINLLKREKVKNMAAQIDGFIDSFDTLIRFMTQQLVL